ncbi:MAG: acyl carrier protein [Bacteroidetes bacterium]|nr:acyl carrier protein [Bacteroidota bacterium]
MTQTEKLKKAFAEALIIDEALVTDTLKYQSIPQWDSITHMVLVSSIEEAFELSLDTEEIIDLSSVAKAKEILSKKGITF